MEFVFLFLLIKYDFKREPGNSTFIKTQMAQGTEASLSYGQNYTRMISLSSSDYVGKKTKTILDETSQTRILSASALRATLPTGIKGR